jgi:endonuclease/exonuclease/phosphatase (EEP) superfamily protein YafD
MPAANKPVRARPKRRRRGCAYYLCGFLCLVASGLGAALWAAQRYYVDRSEWAFMATYGPQVVFVFVPLGLAAFALLLWQWRWVGCNLLLALVVAQVFVRPTWPHLPRRCGPEQRVCVVSWNVHEESGRTGRVRAALEPLGADVICLQEASQTRFRELLSGYQAAHSHDVTTLTRGRLVSSREIRLGALPNWRYGLETVVELPQGRVTVLNLHWLAVQMPIRVGMRFGAPEAYARSRLGRQKQEAVTTDWMREITGSALVVGDFNTPPNVAEYERLARLATNAWEAGRGFGFTFHRRQPVIRIDHVWCLGEVLPVRCEVRDGGVSDHLMVIADVGLPDDREMGDGDDGP